MCKSAKIEQPFGNAYAGVLSGDAGVLSGDAYAGVLSGDYTLTVLFDNQ